MSFVRYDKPRTPTLSGVRNVLQHHRYVYRQLTGTAGGDTALLHALCTPSLYPSSESHNGLLSEHLSSAIAMHCSLCLPATASVWFAKHSRSGGHGHCMYGTRTTASTLFSDVQVTNMQQNNSTPHNWSLQTVIDTRHTLGLVSSVNAIPLKWLLFPALPAPCRPLSRSVTHSH